MIKKTLYPKTMRISDNLIVITEKLDGSNLGFFKVKDDLLIAQRNWIFMLSEIDEVRDRLYKGLYDWLKGYGNDLKDRLHCKSGIFGEWIGMGKIKYNFEGFYMFAKANIDEEVMEAYSICYDHDLFAYPFTEQTIPDYINIVPVVQAVKNAPSISELDDIYEEYADEMNRHVEGFVINHTKGDISKYVRRKNGKLESHKE